MNHRSRKNKLLQMPLYNKYLLQYKYYDLVTQYLGYYSAWRHAEIYHRRNNILYHILTLTILLTYSSPTPNFSRTIPISSDLVRAFLYISHAPLMKTSSLFQIKNNLIKNKEKTTCSRKFLLNNTQNTLNLAHLRFTKWFDTCAMWIIVELAFLIVVVV